MSQSTLVFSTHVEVIPTPQPAKEVKRGILHTCGGDPQSWIIFEPSVKYSPHMWRWSRLSRSQTRLLDVFSTHVEVILKWMWQIACIYCILHTCGGDPKHWYKASGFVVYSPHMWRWSLLWCLPVRNCLVFSTHVEVILIPSNFAEGAEGILHTCWECYCPWAHR